jgi:very-short-patch-repair endonuclease
MVGMRKEVRTHQRLAALAARQHGIVSARQLRHLDYSAAAITRAAQAGRLHRVHRGVYAVGNPRLTKHGRCLAAVAACRPNALLSHASAAWLWGLLSSCPLEAEVTVPTRRRHRPSLRIHFSILPTEDGGRCEAIPVTAPPRTLLDLATTGPRSRLDRAIQKAERLDLLDLGAIDAMLRRNAGAPGTGHLRGALEIYRDPVFARSRPERLLRDLVRKAALPLPSTNVYVAGHEVDAYWEHERFAVEVDGWEAHRGRVAFEEDPIRQEDLKLAGIDSLRITARRIEREPAQVAARLGTLLERRRSALQ